MIEKTKNKKTKWKVYLLIEITLLIISSFLYFYSCFHLKLLEIFLVRFFIYCGIGLFFLISVFSPSAETDDSKNKKLNKFFTMFKNLRKNYNSFYLNFYSDKTLLNLLILRIISSVLAGYGSLSLLIMDNIFNYHIIYIFLPIYLCILLLIILEKVLLLMKMVTLLPDSNITNNQEQTILSEKFYLMYMNYFYLDKYSKESWIFGFFFLAIIAYILASLSKTFSLKILFFLACFILFEISIYPKATEEANKIIDFFNYFKKREKLECMRP